MFRRDGCQKAFHEAAIRKLHGGGLIGVRHGSDDVTATSEILEQEGVIGERPGVTRCEDDDRMGAVGNRSDQATVCGHGEWANVRKLGEVFPNCRRSVFGGLALLIQRGWIPESDRQFARSAVCQIRVVASEINQIRSVGANGVGTRRARYGRGRRGGQRTQRQNTSSI